MILNACEKYNKWLCSDGTWKTRQSIKEKQHEFEEKVEEWKSIIRNARKPVAKVPRKLREETISENKDRKVNSINNMKKTMRKKVFEKGEDKEKSGTCRKRVQISVDGEGCDDEEILECGQTTACDEQSSTDISGHSSRKDITQEDSK